MSVLVVDDSLTVRMDLVEALEAAGLEAASCASLEAARVALQDGRVRLLILDVVLPDGDGVDLLSELRADPATRSLPVLVLSSEAEVKDRIRGLRTGADEYVGKPYDTGHVIARSRELLRSGTPFQPGPSVLVIDDSATVREGLRTALEAAGYRVVTAASGEEGLLLAEQHRPTAIVVDGLLPGIDGATVIRHVRLDAALRRTPCLLLTGSAERGGELAALDAGADAYLRKDETTEVLLARLAAVIRAGDATPVDATGLLGPKKVLAVDDSATYRQALADLLRSEGYDVVLARSGEEALELLSVQRVDCILLDVVMPGIGGTETCRRIKESSVVRDTPIIMLTSLDDRRAMVEGLAAGADDYIAKSSEIEVLQARVRAQLRRRQFEDENRRIREELLRREIDATEARAATTLAEARAAMVDELERKNRELEAFSYTVSHDLRAPLRAIDGFSLALLEDQGDRLDAVGREHIGRVRSAAQRMGELIDDLLTLSRIGRSELVAEPVNVTRMAHLVVAELRRRDPARAVEVVIDPDLHTVADAGLLRVVLENLLGNAWKFTARATCARIELTTSTVGGSRVWVVRDNGAGFDTKYADKLFRPFQRLHRSVDFTGTGIGLATVQRIVERHGGRIWADAVVGQGATFSFTLSEAT